MGGEAKIALGKTEKHRSSCALKKGPTSMNTQTMDFDMVAALA